MAELATTSSAPIHTSEPSTLENDQLFSWCKQQWGYDSEHWRDWRKTAEEDFDFAALEQWKDEDKALLEAQSRAPITMDSIGPMLRAIQGQEISNRQEARYIPVEMGDVQINDVLSDIAKWFRTRCSAEKEESEAFFDMLICGMGWTELCLDYEENHNGDFKQSRVDPLEMLVDFKSQKANCKDARRLWRIKDISLADAKEQFWDEETGDEFSAFDLDAAWARDSTLGVNKQQVPLGDRYTEAAWSDPKMDADTRKDGMVTIVECQWYEKKAYYLVSDPETGEEAEFTPDQYEKTLDRLAQMPVAIPFSGVRLTKRVYMRAFLGSKVLKITECPDPKSFSYKCVTGFRDRNRGTWFGMVKPMKDPQRWHNKWLTQILHILNSQAAGGLMAEEDATSNWPEIEANWTKPNYIAKFKTGAMAGGKVQPKPTANLPQGYFTMQDIAKIAMRDATGISLEQLGMREANQPGVLEYQRRQQGIIILSGLFDNLREMRLETARSLLYFMQTYLSDERLVRIGGEQAGVMIPLIRDMTIGEYDVIVDDVPTSPNQKEQIWQMITALLPMIGPEALSNPAILAIILKYSPFPASFVQELQGAMQPPPPDPVEDEAKQIQLEGAKQTVRGLAAEASKDEADVALKNAQAQKALADTVKAMAEAHNPQAFRPAPQRNFAQMQQRYPMINRVQ